MKERFVIYGLLGWTMEIFWTGLASLAQGDPRLQGVSYLWMFPIYGLAVFLEPVHERIRNRIWVIRGLIWTVVIFTIEFLSGALIKSLTGLIPWDYTGSSRYAILGLIRLDYAPAWFAAGLLFEKLHDYLSIKLNA